MAVFLIACGDDEADKLKLAEKEIARQQQQIQQQQYAQQTLEQQQQYTQQALEQQQQYNQQQQQYAQPQQYQQPAAPVIVQSAPAQNQSSGMTDMLVGGLIGHAIGNSMNNSNRNYQPSGGYYDRDPVYRQNNTTNITKNITINQSNPVKTQPIAVQPKPNYMDMSKLSQSAQQYKDPPVAKSGGMNMGKLRSYGSRRK